MTDELKGPMTAASFAEGLQGASFMEVGKIIQAITVARAGSRKELTGDDLMNAAQYILHGTMPDDTKPKPEPKPAKPKATKT